VAEPLLVVGLGNPGETYARTRHNLGFLVADLLAARLGSKFKAHKRSGAEVITGRLAGRSVVLAKPRCYMNESGRQVGPLAKFYSVPPADIIVVHDELDLEFGRIRLKLGGGEGGHNGVRSVAAGLGTTDFQRVRIGIGRPPGRKDPAAFVLENFTAATMQQLTEKGQLNADSTMKLADYSFGASQPLTPGHHTILVENAGPQPHEIVLLKLSPGKSVGDFGKWAMEGMKGPPPAIPLGGLGSIESGGHGVFTVDLAPGDYGFICFVPDVKDGKPHLAHGMIMQFKVG